MSECPVCNIDRADIVASRSDTKHVSCPRCGDFRISHEAEVNLQHDGEEWAMRVACVLRHATLSGSLDNKFSADDLEYLKGTWREKGVVQKQNALILALAALTKLPGSPVLLVAECDHVLAWCSTVDEFNYHLNALVQRQLVTCQTMDPEWTVTPNGWERVEQLSMADPLSTDLVFVAMSFDGSLAAAWTEGLFPGIGDAGYRPERVDTAHHADKIDDRIMAKIRESRFVVVDVTTQNRGAYFEAGFALGLGRRVIWCVREDDLGAVHFDTRQFNHVVWKEPADLRIRMRDRILGVFGRGPRR